MKTIDLSDLKAGDKAWSCIDGECVVQKSDMVDTWAIQCKDIWCIKCLGEWYAKNGILYEDDTHPTLFHSEQEFREYWGMESKQLPTRAEFAMAAMQGLLANGMYSSHTNEGVVDYAIEIADALLTKLNENQ
jgi:hypothetical protein